MTNKINTKCVARKTEECGMFSDKRRCDIDLKFGTQLPIIEGEEPCICCKFNFYKPTYVDRHKCVEPVKYINLHMYYLWKSNGHHIKLENTDIRLDYTRKTLLSYHCGKRLESLE